MTTEPARPASAADRDGAEGVPEVEVRDGSGSFLFYATAAEADKAVAAGLGELHAEGRVLRITREGPRARLNSGDGTVPLRGARHQLLGDPALLRTHRGARAEGRSA